jgi:hypothetical protein
MAGCVSSLEVNQQKIPALLSEQGERLIQAPAD